MAKPKAAKKSEGQMFAWRDHIPLLVSASLPVLAVCQVASLAGYNVPMTLVILSSAGSTVGILLRAFLAALPLFSIIFTASLVAFILTLKITRHPYYEYYDLGRGVKRFAPLITGILTISLALAPWTVIALAVALSTALVIFGVLLTLLLNLGARLVARWWPDASPEVPPRVAAMSELLQAPQRSTFMRSAVVAYMLFIWMIGVPWTPFEALRVDKEAPFTGFVVGMEGEKLVVVTAGDPAIVRVPVASTERNICIPTRVNRVQNRWQLLPDMQLNYRRTIPQLVAGIENRGFVECPTANAPVSPPVR